LSLKNYENIIIVFPLYKDKILIKTHYISATFR